MAVCGSVSRQVPEYLSLCVLQLESNKVCRSGWKNNNSLDNGVHVLLNSTLSAEGKAQMLSHELYGHALLYQRNQPHTHDVRNGVEQNSLLRAAIIRAISETKQNMRGR